MPGRIRRTLPLYIVFVFIFIFLVSAPREHFEKYQNTSGEVLRRISAYRQTFRRETKFPKKIWQTWKVDPLDFDERDSGRARTWTSTNPGYRYEVLTDGNDMDWVETHYGPDGENRPDIVETYRTLNATIIKADLLRYLVMYVAGGIYADIDVSAKKPIDEWIPEHFNETDVDMIISVEIDEPTFVNHTILGPKSMSFCQWTFASKPRQPVMMRLIEHVLHWLNEVSQRQNKPISDIELNFDEVITGTGPSAFTNAFLSEMTAQTRKQMVWDTFHNLTEPVLVGNILVMTVFAFAAGQGHSNSGNHDDPRVLVQHHYHASKWPSRHPRFSHPAYGMVEECNWNPECVGNWTQNTDLWDLLDEPEKNKRIAQHEADIAKKFEEEEAERMQHEREDAERAANELKDKCLAASYVPAPPSESTATESGAAATGAPAAEGEAPPAPNPEEKHEEGGEKKAEGEKKTDLRMLGSE
jgi:mannosyltransferase OCH1-like enzyme